MPPAIRTVLQSGGQRLVRLGRGAQSGSDFEGSQYLLKWMILGLLVGLVAGVGAIVFANAIEISTRFFLGDLVGYLPPAPVGEGEPVRHAIGRPWLLPVIVAAGGLISGLIVYWLAPEAKGHGTDAAIAAIHHRGGRLRARIPPIKLVASAITIGSGGSGGREGPAAQISAGFGSVLGQWLNLSPQDRRILVAAGMGAGIGAIFRAPLGGAVMAVEILYIHDVEFEALIPSLIASIVGYSVFGAVEGFEPIFGSQPNLGLDHPVALLYYALLGIVCGLGGLLYARVFYGTERLFDRVRAPAWLKPAIGGLLVGLIGIWVHGALHTGYGWVQISMSDELLTLPLWIVIALPFAKILATSLSIGSGGSAGIFGPGMVIGAMFGATFWRLGHDVLPRMPDSPAPFVIVGMMALFGGIAHAPLAVMLMVAEMTGNLSLLAPAMVAVALSTAMVGNNTIYTSQLPNRASSPAHRMQFSFPLLSTLLARDAMTPIKAVVYDDDPVQALADDVRAGRSDEPIAVFRRDGKFAGLLTPALIGSVSASGIETTRAGALMELIDQPLAPDTALDVALERLSEAGIAWLPVVDEGHAVGQLSAANIMTEYRASLDRSVRRARRLPESALLFEARLGPASAIVGQTIRRAGLPPDTLIVSIIRDGETVFPRAATELRAGDVVLVVAAASSEASIRAYLEGSQAASAIQPSG
jgi:chloride channel protein, CIC family